MTRESILSWVRQLRTMQETINTVNTNIDQLKGSLHIAEAVDNDKQKAAIQTDLSRFTRDRDKMLTELCQRANRTDYEGVDTLLTDITIRLELVDTLFDQWRRRLAQLEFLISTNALVENPEEGPTAHQLNAAIDEAKMQYEAALTNADQLIPNKAVLIHV